ncbi:hypothetical protein EVAR_12439_1 [Eumeta japonica]|uniref:Uncharacterized protein n=1 Tax=Eumeta variegata TaxID=151549 RepID=A0A4C1TZG9_EUMVA|nr:hypothetical protein EVAR_12439_1 [Eumeta japonica]
MKRLMDVSEAREPAWGRHAPPYTENRYVAENHTRRAAGETLEVATAGVPSSASVRPGDGQPYKRATDYRMRRSIGVSG